MANKSFMVLIDGTGPYSGAQYERDFEFSFLRQLHKQLKESNSAYFQGPGTMGGTTASKAGKGFEAVKKALAANPGCKLFIAGYSRGGAAAMELAKACAYGPEVLDNPAMQTGIEKGQRLREEKYPDLKLPSDRYPAIPIEAIFLLDPVCKEYACYAPGGGIPRNVKRAYCMYRDKTIWEYSPKLNQGDFAHIVDKGLASGFNGVGWNDPDRYARKFMENAKYELAPGNAVTDRRKPITIPGASHGAIGGLPWVERWEDEQPARDAASLLNGWLNENRITAKVRDNSYTAANKKSFRRVPPPHETLERDMKMLKQHGQAIFAKKALR